MGLISLERVIDQLRLMYTETNVPALADPWELILWENIAYLADDRKRQEAMIELQQKVGTTPEEILSAPRDRLREVIRRGIVPEQSVEKVCECAQLAVHEFAGDLQCILKMPVAKAKKALKKFPGIGDPGAEKILLFCHKLPVLALESNGLRVLVRLGFAAEHKNYSTMYQKVREAVEDQIPSGFPWLIEAHLLLRRHGQELCRRTRPRCQECPLAAGCNDFLARSRGSPSGESAVQRPGG
jgi:endonuclease III